MNTIYPGISAVNYRGIQFNRQYRQTGKTTTILSDLTKLENSGKKALVVRHHDAGRELKRVMEKIQLDIDNLFIIPFHEVPERLIGIDFDYVYVDELPEDFGEAFKLLNDLNMVYSQCFASKEGNRPDIQVYFSQRGDHQ